MAITDPVETSDDIYSASTKISNPLQQAIVMGEREYSYNLLVSQISAKAEVQKQRREQTIEVFENKKEELSAPLKQSVELACERGASSWLTTLPITEFGFTLHKGDFRDAIALIYGWPPNRMPSN